jgi:hypothetical protein
LAHLEAAFEDQTKLTGALLPNSLWRLDTILEWGSNDEELASPEALRRRRAP